MTMIERERKFSVAHDAALPDLSAVADVGDPTTWELHATYLDTPTFSLLSQHVALRRRIGGSDEGWHLKLPAEPGTGGRTEIHAPLGEHDTVARIPLELRAQIADLVGLQPLLPIADLRTTRVEYPVTARDGAKALLADDSVTAARLHQEPESWREVEVEMVSGDPAFLDVVEDTLRRQGVVVSAYASKVGRAVGDLTPRSPLEPDSAAADVVMAYVAVQVGVIQAREAGVRSDETDAVHKTRVATRRLRSVLRTYQALWAKGATKALRSELSWLADVLGEPRDAEVLRDRLAESLDALEPELVVGPVRERLINELHERHTARHGALVQCLDSPRFFALLDALVTFVTMPPVSKTETRSARKVLPHLVRQPARRVEGLREEAEAAEDLESQLALLHEVRKAAKAARYAAEALGDLLGRGPIEAARRWEAVTEEMGELQDSVVAREVIAAIGAQAEAAGESPFTYGVLAGIEHDRGEAVRSRISQIIAAAVPTD